MKITVDREDGTPPIIWDGTRAELLASGVQILWKNYCVMEARQEQAFQDLIKVLRK